jgi:4-amino-4-deoxy-L-arabinose transferase-like glycosyltransferase
MILQHNKTRSFQLVFLLLLVVASIGVRAIAWTRWHPTSIEAEGAEYARIAENLKNGLGYVGINFPGTELIFPPLFPLLIAAVSTITHNYETAGRLVSFVFSALLPLAVFGVTRRLFDNRTAIVAAILTVLHPLFIALSISTYSEGIYATLLLACVYLVLRAFDHPYTRNWLLVGLIFGVSYLVRQAAFLPLLIAIFFSLFVRDTTPRVKIKHAVVAMAAFFILAAPEVILLYKTTGKLQLEGKSAFNYAIGIRTLDGLSGSKSEDEFGDSVNRAVYSIDDNLEGTGVAMRPNAEIVRETRINPKDLVRFEKVAFIRNIPTMLSQFSAKWLGAPFLPALAFLGVFCRPIRRRMALSQLFCLVIPVTTVLATFSVIHAVYPRYYFILLPFLVIWAANGLVEVARWTNSSLAAMFRWKAPIFGVALSGVMAIAMLGYALKGTKDLYIFKASFSDGESLKDAGLWILDHETRKVRIMDLTSPLAFYADAELVHFPYCESQQALRFADAQQVDYIVLSPGEKFTRYYGDWLQHGVPDAELVYSSAAANPNQVLVFRRHRNG